MRFIQDLEVLHELLQDLSLENVNETFGKVLIHLSEYLGYDPVFKKVEVSVLQAKDPLIDEQSPFNIGVRRIIQNNSLTIETFQNCEDFLPFIVLREAYYSFLPRKSITVELAINSFVENNLKKSTNIKEWKKLIREKLIHDKKITDILSTYEKLPSEIINPVFMFFKYVRENISVIDQELDDFVKRLQEISYYDQYELLFNGETIETLRILIDIFFKVKIFNTLKDYKAFFIKFRESNIIQTDLSIKKFMDNLKLISNSVISPSYQLDWESIGVSLMICYFRFHPMISFRQINEIVKELPFLISSKFIFSGSCTDVHGIFLIPGK